MEGFMAYILDFEKPLVDLEKKVAGLRKKGERLSTDDQKQLQKDEQELQHLTKTIYANLSAWQTVSVSRHKDRPHAVDYLRLMCDEFFELRGDRISGDNPTIVGGPAQLGGHTVLMLGHEKGRTMKEQQLYNVGMAHPEGFRKAHRLMKQAEKFGFPVICLIDTPGASITIDDEKQGQARAIADNLYLMAQLRTPIISTVIGEGGSGGALALGVADRQMALEHSYYAVAAPESAASIVWRSSKFAPEIALAQRINARQLKELNLIDELIPEPLGGAHRDSQVAAQMLKEALIRQIEDLKKLTLDTLLEQRYHKLRSIGGFGYAESTDISEVAILDSSIAAS